jgi:hypothetical protein
MFIPITTLLVIVAFAFLLGMLTSFVMIIQAMMRLKK